MFYVTVSQTLYASVFGANFGWSTRKQKRLRWDRKQLLHIWLFNHRLTRRIELKCFFFLLKKRRKTNEFVDKKPKIILDIFYLYNFIYAFFSLWNWSLDKQFSIEHMFWDRQKEAIHVYCSELWSDWLFFQIPQVLFAMNFAIKKSNCYES